MLVLKGFYDGIINPFFELHLVAISKLSLSFFYSVKVTNDLLFSYLLLYQSLKTPIEISLFPILKALVRLVIFFPILDPGVRDMDAKLSRNDNIKFIALSTILKHLLICDIFSKLEPCCQFLEVFLPKSC